MHKAKEITLLAHAKPEGGRAMLGPLASEQNARECKKGGVGRVCCGTCEKCDAFQQLVRQLLSRSRC